MTRTRGSDRGQKSTQTIKITIYTSNYAIYERQIYQEFKRRTQNRHAWQFAANQWRRLMTMEERGILMGWVIFTMFQWLKHKIKSTAGIDFRIKMKATLFMYNCEKTKFSLQRKILSNRYFEATYLRNDCPYAFGLRIKSIALKIA